MQKSFLVIAFLLLACSGAFSQDQLFKKDNSKLDVKILEINPTEVKYKLKTNPDGPTYVVSKSEVALIIYQNGEHEAFKEEVQQLQNPQPIFVEAPARFPNIDSINTQRSRLKNKEFEAATRHNNVLFYNMGEIFNSAIGISYFRELIKNLIDIHVPLSFSLGEPYAYNLLNSSSVYNNNNVSNFKVTQKAFDVGVGIYVNTTGKRLVSHFIGPLFRIAQYNGAFQIASSQSTVNNPSGYSYTVYNFETHGFVYNESYFFINNGILFRVTPNFNVMISAALGLVVNRTFVANDPSSFQTPNGYNGSYGPNVTLPTVQFGFNMGYRF